MPLKLGHVWVIIYILNMTMDGVTDQCPSIIDHVTCSIRKQAINILTEWTITSNMHIGTKFLSLLWASTVNPLGNDKTPIKKTKHSNYPVHFMANSAVYMFKLRCVFWSFLDRILNILQILKNTHYAYNISHVLIIFSFLLNDMWRVEYLSGIL